MIWSLDKISKEDILSVTKEGWASPIAKFVNSTGLNSPKVGYVILDYKGLAFIVKRPFPITGMYYVTLGYIPIEVMACLFAVDSAFTKLIYSAELLTNKHKSEERMERINEMRRISAVNIKADILMVKVQAMRWDNESCLLKNEYPMYNGADYAGIIEKLEVLSEELTTAPYTPCALPPFARTWRDVLDPSSTPTL